MLHDVVGQLLEEDRVVMLIIDVFQSFLGFHLMEILPVYFFCILDGFHDISDADGFLPDHN